MLPPFHIQADRPRSSPTLWGRWQPAGLSEGACSPKPASAAPPNAPRLRVNHLAREDAESRKARRLPGAAASGSKKHKRTGFVRAEAQRGVSLRLCASARNQLFGLDWRRARPAQWAILACPHLIPRSHDATQGHGFANHFAGLFRANGWLNAVFAMGWQICRSPRGRLASTRAAPDSQDICVRFTKLFRCISHERSGSGRSVDRRCSFSEWRCGNESRLRDSGAHIRPARPALSGDRNFTGTRIKAG